MKLIKTAFLFLLFFSSQHYLLAQTIPSSPVDESNSSASGISNAADYSEMMERYSNHTLNVNTADRGALNELQLLTSIQISALIIHRMQYGPLLSTYELQSVPGFDVETIKRILPYINVGENQILSKENLKHLIKGGEHLLILYYEQPMQKSQGFLNGNDSNEINDYLGPNLKTNLRYRYSKGTKFSAGFNADNDVGEPLFNARQPKGFDFYSAHLFIKDLGIIRQLAIGDYHLSIGQGLGIGSGFVLNKSIEVLQIHRYAAGLRPYRSMNEFGFFRGIATTLGSEKFSVLLYSSIKKVDGNVTLKDSSLFAVERYYNLVESGYHRTNKELLLKNTATQKVYGGYVQTQLKRFHAGIGYSAQELNLVTRFLHADINYTTNNYTFFCEAATQQGGGKGLLTGVMASLHKNLDFAIIYRNYNSKYNNPFSNAFCNGASPSNEKGIYFGSTLKLNKGFRILGYMDLYSMPMPTSRNYGSSHGYDYSSAIQYQPSKSFRLELRYRVSGEQVNITSVLINTVGYLIQQQRGTWRIQCDYSYSKELVFRTRMEQTWAENEVGMTQVGNLIFQDIHYNAPKGKFGVDFRYALFNINGSNARIYSFENDVPYTFSMVQLSGVGSRFYMMASYRMRRNASLWLRYSNSFFPYQNELGSGLDKISGNTKETIKLLLKISF